MLSGRREIMNLAHTLCTLFGKQTTCAREVSVILALSKMGLKNSSGTIREHERVRGTWREWGRGVDSRECSVYTKAAVPRKNRIRNARAMENTDVLKAVIFERLLA